MHRVTSVACGWERRSGGFVVGVVLVTVPLLLVGVAVGVGGGAGVSRCGVPGLVSPWLCRAPGWLVEVGVRVGVPGWEDGPPLMPPP